MPIKTNKKEYYRVKALTLKTQESLMEILVDILNNNIMENNMLTIIREQKYTIRCLIVEDVFNY